MTNEMILFLKGQELAEQGIIKYTGREYKGTDPAGNPVVIKETEPIHTYNIWKSLGYQVQKGEKAVAKITIWKHTAKEKDGEKEEKMFMKTSSFFSQSQVQPV